MLSMRIARMLLRFSPDMRQAKNNLLLFALRSAQQGLRERCGEYFAWRMSDKICNRMWRL